MRERKMKRQRASGGGVRLKWGDNNKQESSGDGSVEKSALQHVTAKNRTMTNETSCESSRAGYAMTIFLFLMAIGVVSWVSFAYTVGNSLGWFMVWIICHAYFLKMLRDLVLMVADDEKEGWKRKENFKQEDGKKWRNQYHFWGEKMINEVRKALLKYGRSNQKGQAAVDRDASGSDNDIPEEDYRHLLFMDEDDDNEEEYNNSDDDHGRKGLCQTLEWKIGGRTLSLVRQMTVEHTLSEEAMIQDLLQRISDSPSEKNQFNPKWTIARERRGITIWTNKPSASTSSPIRGRMVCAATPAELLSLLIDDERISEYDNLFDKVLFMKRLNDRTVVRRSCYRAIWPTRPRDFVIKTTWEEFADGSVVIGTHSVVHPDFPPSPTYTRGKIFMCGYVIVPQCQEEYSAGPYSPLRQQCSEITIYAHTDLGGNLPATIVNRLSKKPAYRVLRKIQKMVVGRTLVSKPVRKRSSKNMSLSIEHSSQDTLDNLLDSVNELNCSQEIIYPLNAKKPLPSMSDIRSVDNNPMVVAPIDRLYAMAKAWKIMGALERMASDSAMDWVELLTVEDRDSNGETFLYKSNVPGSSEVHLGACSIILTAPEELLGLLLESAAMLGPDYFVEKQEVIETLQSEVGSTTTSRRVPSGDQKGDDTAIFWFTCTHKRQRIHRDFVILRCFRPLPGGGGLIAYSSVEHPAFPPSPAYVRGKIELCGFVVVPKPSQGGMTEEVEESLRDNATTLHLQPDVNEMGRCSSVTYFSCLRFCDYLPAFEDLQVSRHFMGPLHVLEELKRVVKETLYVMDEEHHGDDTSSIHSCSTPPTQSTQQSWSSTPSDHQVGVEFFEESPLSPAGFENSLMKALNNSSQSSCSSLAILSPKSPGLLQAPERSMGSTNHSMVSVQKVTQMHEAAVRDLLALASDGEYMGDGPQVDWNLKQDRSDLKLWSSKISECGWRVSSTTIPLKKKFTLMFGHWLGERLDSLLYRNSFVRISCLM